MLFYAIERCGRLPLRGGGLEFRGRLSRQYIIAFIGSAREVTPSALELQKIKQGLVSVLHSSPAKEKREQCAAERG
jgi:hypothetical protein